MDQRDEKFEVPDQVEVRLKKPLKKAASSGEVLEVLTFRPPTMGEMKQVAKVATSAGDAESAVRLLVLLSNDGLTAPEIERMNYLDAQLCVEALQPFLELRPRASSGG